MADKFNIDDYLNKLRNPDEETNLDTVYDELRTGVMHQIDIRDAKIEETTDAAQKAAAEVSRLKAANYDYMQQIPAATNAPTPNDDDDDKPSGISSLFGK